MDAEAFADEVADLHLRLVRVTYLLCGDAGLAEECAQEALLRAWERSRRGEAVDSLAGWTTTVALNACRSALRRRSAETRALGRLPRVREAVDPTPVGEADEVHAAVLALPPRQREVVVLHYFCDLDVAAIAAHAGLSTGAVKNALFHARAALATRLGAAVPEEAP
ncbi:MAG TPA: sigma-70 family RNA polymerase sigma factor [Iamia sp.]|nr:sigma-70 family RNA polymerase sigma factor [Iamia sp.]